MSELSAQRKLLRGITELGFPDGKRICDALLKFGSVLIAAGKETNLTGAHDLQELIAPHFLDSLAPLARAKLLDPILDLGSGAGLPGIPAAIAFPESKIVLLEPRTKRVDFLTMAVAQLALQNVAVVKGSAASLSSTNPKMAGTILLRAVAPPEEALSMAAPLVKNRGTILIYTGKAASPSSSLTREAKKHGLSLLYARQVTVPFLDADRHVWAFKHTGGSSR